VQFEAIWNLGFVGCFIALSAVLTPAGENPLPEMGSNLNRWRTSGWSGFALATAQRHRAVIQRDGAE